MLALALAALMAALIPKDYVFIALLGTFPFWLIGAIAAWRQIASPNQERLDQILEQVRQQTWQEFSKKLHDGWRMQGIHATPADMLGVDWRIAKEGSYSLVCAKRWKASVHGLEPFRQLAAAMEVQGIPKGLYIAAGGEVSPSAQRFAREHHITIWLGDELSHFLVGKMPADE